MHDELADEGLVIVGVSNEGAKLIADSIENNDMRFPIGRVSGGTVDSAYGIRAFPTTYVIAPDGTVAYGPGSSGSYVEVIRELLPSVVLVEPLEGREYRSINNQLEDNELGRAYRSIERALERSPEDEQLLRASEQLEGIHAAQMASIEAKCESGAYADALRAAERLAEMFDGCDLKDAAREAAREIERSEEAEDDLRADRLLQQAQRNLEINKKAKRELARRQLEEIIADYPATATADRARSLLRTITR